jgi:hypothetical protein
MSGAGPRALCPAGARVRTAPREVKRARGRASLVSAVLLALATLAVDASSTTASSPAPNEEIFALAVESLNRGAPTEAIDHLELLADRGVVHPDASFNRGLAYVARAESDRVRPGDLGRAAAAFAEALALGPGDADARLLLEQVREEIARRRVRAGAKTWTARVDFRRTIVGLVPESTWAIGAAFGSILTSVGLCLGLWWRRRTHRIAGALLGGVGVTLLVVLGALTAAARHHRLSDEPAVVVVPEAHLTDAAGRKLTREAAVETVVIEGAEVYVLERRGQRARIESSGLEGWVAAEALRLLPRR